MHYKKGTGWVETSGAKVCSDREMSLRLARVYGKTGDSAAFTRLLIESRGVSKEKLLAAFRGTECRDAEARLKIGAVLTGAVALGQTVKLT